MTKDERKVLGVVRAGKGRYWTAEIARRSGIESSDAGGGHQNWVVHDILESLERRKFVQSKGGGGPGRRRYWEML
ncbi:MAG: hypothetical protein ACR2QC_03290 [Gammaproteobacteria bacterium]